MTLSKISFCYVFACPSIYFRVLQMGIFFGGGAKKIAPPQFDFAPPPPWTWFLDTPLYICGAGCCLLFKQFKFPSGPILCHSFYPPCSLTLYIYTYYIHVVSIFFYIYICLYNIIFMLINFFKSLLSEG